MGSSLGPLILSFQSINPKVLSPSSSFFLSLAVSTKSTREKNLQSTVKKNGFQEEEGGRRGRGNGIGSSRKTELQHGGEEERDTTVDDKEQRQESESLREAETREESREAEEDQGSRRRREASSRAWRRGKRALDLEIVI